MQDVEGLVDFYLAAPAVLSLLPTADPRTRERALATLPPGGRFPALAMTLARFGLDAAAASALDAGMVDRTVVLRRGRYGSVARPKPTAKLSSAESPV